MEGPRHLGLGPAQLADCVPRVAAAITRDLWEISSRMDKTLQNSRDSCAECPIQDCQIPGSQSSLGGHSGIRKCHNHSPRHGSRVRVEGKRKSKFTRRNSQHSPRDVAIGTARCGAHEAEVATNLVLRSSHRMLRRCKPESSWRTIT